MATIRNCRRCGKIFAFMGSDVCPACRREEERQFDDVKDFLGAHPEADLDAVAEATGVPVDAILRFLREGRLVHANAGLSCERCGRRIASGRYCSRCVDELAKSLGEGGTKGSTFYGAPLRRDRRGNRDQGV